MEFIKTTIPEILIIKPKVFDDSRGYFAETYRQKELNNALGFEVNFCQDNENISKKGVLRGLHFQLPPFAQSKLVRVTEGEVLDVVVDIRQDSPTFGKHISEIISSSNMYQLFIPRGFAHGFVVLSDRALFSYKVDNYYSYNSESWIFFDDPSLGIDWKLPPDQLILSKKDLKQPLFKQIKSECSQFNYFKNLYE